MRMPPTVSRRVSILLISSVLLPGCGRTPPAAPSNAAPPVTPGGLHRSRLSHVDPSHERLPAGGGSAAVTATVADAVGNGVAGAAVAFAATAGVLSNAEGRF